MPTSPGPHTPSDQGSGGGAAGMPPRRVDSTAPATGARFRGPVVRPSDATPSRAVAAGIQPPRPGVPHPSSRRTPVSTRNTTLRALHDVGLAAWFGGSLFGVAGLNAAAEEAQQQRTTARITSVGWAKWAPVNAAFVGAHLVGGAGLLAANRKRAAV